MGQHDTDGDFGYKGWVVAFGIVAVIAFAFAISWGIEAAQWRDRTEVTATVASCRVERDSDDFEWTYCNLLLPDGSLLSDVQLAGEPRDEGAEVQILVRGESVQDPELLFSSEWKYAAALGVLSVLLAVGVVIAGTRRGAWRA
jgi:hypothetical protein